MLKFQIPSSPEDTDVSLKLRGPRSANLPKKGILTLHGIRHSLGLPTSVSVRNCASANLEARLPGGGPGSALPVRGVRNGGGSMQPAKGRWRDDSSSYPQSGLLTYCLEPVGIRAYIACVDYLGRKLICISLTS